MSTCIHVSTQTCTHVKLYCAYTRTRHLCRHTHVYVFAGIPLVTYVHVYIYLYTRTYVYQCISVGECMRFTKTLGTYGANSLIYTQGSLVFLFLPLSTPPFPTPLPPSLLLSLPPLASLHPSVPFSLPPSFLPSLSTSLSLSISLSLLAPPPSIPPPTLLLSLSCTPLSFSLTGTAF